MLFRGLSCGKGSRSRDIHTKRIHCWVTLWVQQVIEASGGLVDQCGHTVWILRVATEAGIGWSRATGWAVAISSPQVILQTFHVLRVANPQQLSLLLRAQEGFQDRGIVVEASGGFQGLRQNGGEDGCWHLGWNGSWLRLWLWGSSLGNEREETVGVEVRVAHPNSSGFDGGGHHHRCLWLACGLSDALWIVRISTGFVDFTEVFQVVVEVGAFF